MEANLEGEEEAGRVERTAPDGETEHRLREMHERFETAFSSAPIGMALVDTAGGWLQVNDALCRITGYSAAELQATTLRQLIHPDDVDLGVEALRELTDGTSTSSQVEQRLRHGFGHYVWLLLTISLVRDGGGSPRYLIYHVQDVSERKELDSHLAYLVDHDFLTGLYNRRRFEAELRHHAAHVARYGIPGALLVIDMDNFKDVNDSLGHKAGDDLLKGIVGLLRQRIRRTDVLARLGGDEFGLLLPQADAAEAQIVAGELVNALRRHVVSLGESQVHVSASIGAAMFNGLSEAEVLAYADSALYDAKDAGRNRFALYDPATARRRASPRMGEAARIRSALEDDRFFLCCQPIVDFAADRICRYELLLRLREEGRREPVLPAAFLYTAERFGLIQEIDAWVVRRATEHLAAAARAGRNLILHVNLSGKSIGDNMLLKGIERALTETGIDPSRLVLEVTETSAIANIEHAKSFAERVRGLGCQLALDDFGTGFGTFFYLKNLPFDYLKIDGDYIRDLASSPMDRLVVEGLVTIAQGMGKKTVAEFVSGEDVASQLRAMRVDYGQGFHFGEPQPVSDVLC